MSMAVQSPVLLAPPPHLSEEISTSKMLKRTVSNMGRVISQKSEDILQHPASFKSNGLILSSLILATSRILVANLSAIQAQGTPEGPYRSQESIRTGMREAGGFISSFGLLLAIALTLKAAMRKAWGIPDEKSYPFFEKMAEVIRHRRNPDFKLEKPDYCLDADESFRYNREKAAGLVKRLYAIVGKTLPTEEKAKAEAEKLLMKRIYTWVPIVIPGMVSLYVSGKLLEKFTRKYSGAVVDFLSHHSKSEAAASPAAAQPASVASSSDKTNKNSTVPSHTPTSPVPGSPVGMVAFYAPPSALQANPFGMPSIRNVY